MLQTRDRTNGLTQQRLQSPPRPLAPSEIWAAIRFALTGSETSTFHCSKNFPSMKGTDSNSASRVSTSLIRRHGILRTRIFPTQLSMLSRVHEASLGNCSSASSFTSNRSEEHTSELQSQF